MGRKRWTDEDCDKLRDGWGQMRGGIPELAASMGRSVNSLKVKACKLHLGPWLNAGEYVTLNMLITIIHGYDKRGGAYYYPKWIRLGLPVHKRKNNDTSFKMVKIEEFWKWAEKHQRDLDFAHFEENSLGLEPEWVKRKRKRDRENKYITMPRKCKWSIHEDELLRQMCNRGTTWIELDAAFQRSSDAIRRRIYDLGLTPPKRCKHVAWSENDMNIAAELRREGYSIEWIAKRMGRSTQSVRGKLGWLSKR